MGWVGDYQQFCVACILKQTALIEAYSILSQTDCEVGQGGSQGIKLIISMMYVAKCI